MAWMPSSKKPQKKAPSALAKPVQPDEALAAIVGPEPLPRTELTKRVWAYIREHQLQDAQDRRRIHHPTRSTLLRRGPIPSAHSSTVVGGSR